MVLHTEPARWRYTKPDNICRKRVLYGVVKPARWRDEGVKSRCASWVGARRGERPERWVLIAASDATWWRFIVHNEVYGYIDNQV